jgi:hypothetical protein
MKADTPIALADVTQLTLDEHELLLEGIRERRLRPVVIYEELSLMKAEAKKEMLETQWAKALEMFSKELARADKAMETVEARSRKLRMIKMEIEAL